MPNPQNILQILQSDLKKKTTISYLNVKPGDTLARVSDGTISLFTLASRIGDKASTAEGGNLFLAGNNVKLYLIDRPKAPLPTEPGRQIVVWATKGGMWGNGVVLTLTSGARPAWGNGQDTWLDPEEIKEWAPLPDDCFNELRKGSNK